MHDYGADWLRCGCKNTLSRLITDICTIVLFLFGHSLSLLSGWSYGYCADLTAAWENGTSLFFSVWTQTEKLFNFSRITTWFLCNFLFMFLLLLNLPVGREFERHRAKDTGKECCLLLFDSNKWFCQGAAQVKSSQVELYCHSATCVDIQWNEMSCLAGPQCYINKHKYKHTTLDVRTIIWPT